MFCILAGEKIEIDLDDGVKRTIKVWQGTQNNSGLDKGEE